MFSTVLAAYLPMRALPDRRARPPAVVSVRYDSVSLTVPNGSLKLAGAWTMAVDDRRFGGFSALAVEHGRFLALSDRGAAARFDPPPASHPKARLSDLAIGPGRFDEKWSRDAESLARDRHGRGWWIGYEQRHSLWLYDQGLERALKAVQLSRTGWRDNRGAEGLLALPGALLVTGENGRDAIRIGPRGTQTLGLEAGAEVADAALAPDGSAWLLLRSKGWRGIRQSIAPLLKDGAGYRAVAGWPLPKGAFDNFEGMAIMPRPDGGWRFWLITDDGHRLMARTLLVALDLPAGHDKSPATGAGLSKGL